MQLAIAKDFFQSAADLSTAEKGLVLEFVTRFQATPDHPSHNIEQLRGRAQALSSARINEDLRVIFHRQGELWTLLFVGHHQPAYRWAERRRVAAHPVTGMLQIVETVESVEETAPRVVYEHAPVYGDAAPPLFAHHADDYLLSLGLPKDWLPVLREVRDEGRLLEVIGRLPEDVQERLVDLAAGGLPVPPEPVTPDRGLEDHADFRRRFHVIDQEDELRRMLDAPLEDWIGFLHPSQRALAEGAFNGAVRISGSAGTGKTVVGLHRARHLARQGQQVLVTTFTKVLARNLERGLDHLCAPDERERITVSTVHHVALELAKAAGFRGYPISDTELRGLVAEAVAGVPDPGFARAEWEHVVHPLGLGSLEEYLRVRRSGRGRALGAEERSALWPCFQAVRDALASRDQADWPTVCRWAEAAVRERRVALSVQAVIVDEVQDLKGPELALLAALVPHPSGLMLLGDAEQRIYPGGYSLSALGIDVRGRSHRLRLNYRTTEQIRRMASRVLDTRDDAPEEVPDSRVEARSLLAGPAPALRGYGSPDEEASGIVAQLQTWLQEGLAPEEIAVFARTNARLGELRAAAQAAALPCRRLAADEDDEHAVGFATLHGAKGLEFKAVIVAGCSPNLLPLPAVVKREPDPADRQAARARERRLLYVGMTRARDQLLVTWAGKPSFFLLPLLGDGAGTEAA